MIRFILILILFFIIYKLYNNNIYESMDGSLVYPNYVPNTNMKFVENIIPFDIDYMCKDENTKKYLGWPCFWRNYESNYSIKYPNTVNNFANYLNNTPLKYDGIWKEKCKGDKQYCRWIIE